MLTCVHPQVPFSASTKVMKSVCVVNGEMVLILKGAFEAVLDQFCERGRFAAVDASLEDCDGDITPEIRLALHAEAARLAGMSYRVIGVAEVPLGPAFLPEGGVSDSWLADCRLEGMTLLGLLALVDPPRDDVPDTIRQLRGAGITVAMVCVCLSSVSALSFAQYLLHLILTRAHNGSRMCR